jgi:LysM domain
VTDDSGMTPAPRPRRRRRDFDPSFVEPPVANERRQMKAATPTPEPLAIGVGPAAVDPAAAPTTLFAVPSATTATTPAAGPRGAWLPLLDDRSPDPAVCPFLRAVDADTIGVPIGAPDAANRCAALREPVPQSLRQQELVCLTSGHVNCPRYLRGAAAVTEVPRSAVRTGRSITPAILGSIVLLVGAFVLSVGFVASRGGMELTGVAIASATPSATTVAAASAAPSALPTSTNTANAVATPTAAPTPASSPSPTPTPPPAATSSPIPTPTATPRPKPSSARYALLTACPKTPDCWIYKVRSGDNLYSIAHYFGVSQAKVHAMNPWLKATGLHAGQSLRLPPPTR